AASGSRPGARCSSPPTPWHWSPPSPTRRVYAAELRRGRGTAGRPGTVSPGRSGGPGSQREPADGGEAVRLHEFRRRGRERGQHHGEEEAEQVSTAVLWVIASRIDPEDAADLAVYLPTPLDDAVRLERGRPDSFGREEFLRRVARQSGAR